MHRKLIIAIIAIAGLLALPAIAANETLLNLQKAYNAEMNAQAQYFAFAQKADEENYGAVASLFRAAAVAEQAHANAHAALIKTFGVNPKASIEMKTVGTTAENVNAALVSEKTEREEMYEPFIKTARAEKRMESLRSFNRAIKAETEHEQIFAKIAQNIDQLKGSTAVTYYVCPVCGEITETMPVADHCKDCGHHTTDYLIVR